VRRLYPATLYVLDLDHGTKVGITSQTIEERVADLRNGSGFEARVVATFPVADYDEARKIERVAHWLLRADRTHGEWFHTHPLIAVDAVKRAMRGNTYLAYLRWQDVERGAA
jgi:hypothetical protein